MLEIAGGIIIAIIILSLMRFKLFWIILGIILGLLGLIALVSISNIFAGFLIFLMMFAGLGFMLWWAYHLPIKSRNKMRNRS